MIFSFSEARVLASVNVVFSRPLSEEEALRLFGRPDVADQRLRRVALTVLGYAP